MNWNLVALIAVAIVVALALWPRGALPEGKARELLKAGAVLVDVRTPGEFAAESLPGAVNIPLDTLAAGITGAVPDKTRTVLLHCRSGRRSGMAEKTLRKLGYTNTFNLGSFEQARRAVGTPNK